MNSPLTLPGATLPTQVGQSMPNTGTYGQPSTVPPTRVPLPPPRPSGPSLGAMIAARAQPPAQAPMPPPRPAMAAPVPPPRPAMAAQAPAPTLMRAPIAMPQTGVGRGGAAPIMTAADLGPALARLFGR